MFREDEKTGLPKKISRKEQQHGKKEAEATEATETKSKTKPQTGKRTGSKPNPRQARAMTLKHANHMGAETEISSSYGWSSAASENTAPSPNRQDTKTTPPTHGATSAEA